MHKYNQVCDKQSLKEQVLKEQYANSSLDDHEIQNNIISKRLSGRKTFDFKFNSPMNVRVSFLGRDNRSPARVKRDEGH